MSAECMGADQFLLGARLLAVGGISLPELCLRMQQMRGCDNLYSTLALLALALTTPLDLATLLDQDVPDLLNARAPPGSGQPGWNTAAYGDAARDAGSRTSPRASDSGMLPELSSIQMGWSFLTPEHTVACLRIDSLAPLPGGF